MPDAGGSTQDARPPREVRPGDSVRVHSGTARHQFVIRRGCNFRVALPIDPAAASSRDDRFILRSDDGDPPTYRQEKTVEDDLVPGDRYTTVEFTNLKPGLAYTLEVDLGQGDKYFLFRAKQFAELQAMDPDRVEVAEHHEDLGALDAPLEPAPEPAPGGDRAGGGGGGLLEKIRRKEQERSLESLLGQVDTASVFGGSPGGQGG